MMFKNHHDWKIEHSDEHVHVEFSHSVNVLSSAVLNGGFVRADHLLNCKVAQNFGGELKDFSEPDAFLAEYCSSMGWVGSCVGMMTSAWMSSYRMASAEEQGVNITTLLTAGVSNAKRAGEEAEWRIIGDKPEKTGTINIIVLTDALLSHAAMAEAIINVTEAKTCVLHDLNISNPSSGLIASGTGTDSVAVCSTGTSKKVNYCGKHVIFGELLSKTVMEALTSSLKG